MNTPSRQFLASSPRGLADLLAGELAAFGAENLKERSTGVAFTGGLRAAYRACLESRVANRVFLELGRFEVGTADDFYAAVRTIPWTEHLGADSTLACDFSGRHPALTHTHFAALKLKDAIVDSVRDRTGSRPDIDVDRPAVRVHAHAHGTNITVSLDLSGDSLHRRGYRGAAGEAPLKENVAAGILLRSGWKDMAAAGAPFLDPLCGSGTLVIEAAMIAAEIAPGLTREYYGFLGWRGHDAPLWADVLAEARESARLAKAKLSGSISIRGQDRDASMIRIAGENARRAGVESLVHFDVRSLSEAAPAPETSHGLLCVNPPYGVRLEDRQGALAVHRELGCVLRERFQGWTAGVLIGSPELGMELGIRAHRTHAVWNGAIECRLLRLKIEPQSEREPGRFGKPDSAVSQSSGARMFANRLAKNLKRLQTWASRAGITCYRLYDADMPEYSFAIDLYHTVDADEAWLYVQEYAAPSEIELDTVRRRRHEALSVLPEVTGVPRERIRVRIRRKTRRGDQYAKVDDQANFHIVSEAGLKFRVNFDDYLDTGLFLDHRITRARLREAAAGKRFLNLFAYTGTATVYAAAGGALSTTTVDLSRTYLDWAGRNLSINGFTGRQHEGIQADCREWLEAAGRGATRYDLIFLDPPTFSNSKRMEGVLDIERDHPALISQCTRLLAPGGLLVFSTNAQRFKLDEDLSSRYAIRDISGATLPKDFERNPRIHRCFEIRDAHPHGSLYSGPAVR